MGNIKIKVTEITIPNNFRILYKSGSTPYPFDTGYTDYGDVFSGGTETIDLIGDFNYGEQYWIMGEEVAHKERWMVKNIVINSSIMYQSFLDITPTTTPSISVSKTPPPSKSLSRTPSPSISLTPTIMPSKTPSKTPTPTTSKTPYPTRTPSRTPSRNGMMVDVTNTNGIYNIIGVSVNGIAVTDISYPVSSGQQKVGSTLQYGTNYPVIVTLSGPSIGERIRILESPPPNDCLETLYESYKTFYFDTSLGMTIYYENASCM